MSDFRLPAGFRIERLSWEHPRRRFRSGQPQVDRWLATLALQNQQKHLSVTKVLLDAVGEVAGYYTLATGQIDFGALPADIVRRLPRRMLPVAVLAWLGVSREHQGRGLGRLLLARALRDCHEAGETFPFVAVIIDCIDARARAFYQRWSFQELPGRPQQLFLAAATLKEMMAP